MLTALDVSKWFLAYNQSESNQLSYEEEAYDGITHLKLQKLLYYAQGLCLAFYKKKLFNDDIQAWQHGPVVPSVYSEYQKFGSNVISLDGMEVDDAVNKVMSDKEAHQILLTTYNNFAIYTAWQLRNMTHKAGSPWEITVKKDGLKSTIPTNLIQKYFEDNIVEA